MIEMNRNYTCSFRKIVSLTVFQSTSFFVVMFEIMLGTDNCSTRSCNFLIYKNFVIAIANKHLQLTLLKTESLDNAILELSLA